MLFVAIIAGWLLIGAIIGRILFVNTLGNAPRLVDNCEGLSDNIYSRCHGRHEWVTSAAYAKAVEKALLSIVFWVFTGIAYMITRPTPAEKLKAKEKKLKEFEDRLAQFDKEYKHLLKEKELDGSHRTDTRKK